MLNHAVYHYLPGAEHTMCICTCGHQEKIKKESENKFTKISQCPSCKAMVAGDFSTLSFGSQEYNASFLMVKELEGKYNFIIDIGTISGAIKAKFSKKIIDFEKSKIKQNHWQLRFNGSLPKDEMLEIVNMDTNEKCEIQEIIDKTSNFKANKFLSTTFHLSNSDYLDLPYIYSMREFNARLQLVYDSVEKLIPYCAKNELLIKIGIDPNKLNGQIDLEKTTPQQQLKLTPFMFKYLKEYGEHNHRPLQQIESLFGNQAINYMNTFATLQEGLSTSCIRRMAGLVNKGNLSIKKLYRFLYIDAPIQQGLYYPDRTLTLLYDSLDLAEKLELPFDKNPKALVRYHDILTKEYNLIKDERKNEDFAKVVTNYKYLEYVEPLKKENDEEESTLKKSLKKQDKFGMILPVDAQDLIREGKLMRHCVASYVDRVIREETIIMYLRRAEDLNTPYVTIEINPDDMKICQVKMKANGKLNDKKAIDFLNKWCEKFNVKWNGNW